MLSRATVQCACGQLLGFLIVIHIQLNDSASLEIGILLSWSCVTQNICLLDTCQRPHQKERDSWVTFIQSSFPIIHHCALHNYKGVLNQKGRQAICECYFLGLCILLSTKKQTKMIKIFYFFACSSNSQNTVIKLYISLLGQCVFRE